MDNQKYPRVILLCAIVIVLLFFKFESNFHNIFYSMKIRDAVPRNSGCNFEKDSIAKILEQAFSRDTKQIGELHLKTLDFLITSIVNYIESNTIGKILNLKYLEAELEKLWELKNGIIEQISEPNDHREKEVKEKEKWNDMEGNFERNETVENYSEYIEYPEQEYTDIEAEALDKNLSKTLTIVLNFNNYTFKDLANVDKLLRDIILNYPGVNVIVYSPYKLYPNLQHENISIVYSEKRPQAGEIWANLINLVKTPHVLILRDAVAMETETRIHSLMHSLKKLDLDLIGGATKDINTGDWSMGCYQMGLRNDVLVYHAGYKSSKNSCVFCHHIDGPFIANTTLMKQHNFSGSEIPEELVFHDLFFNQYRRNISKKFAVCPDSIFITRTVPKVTERSSSKSKWLRFGVKNNVHRVVPPNGVAHTFTCDELGVEENAKGDGKSVPYCTIQELVNHIKFIMKTCKENLIFCELSWGTELAALKFNGMPPWEKDGDVSFFSPQADKLLALEPLFVERGYSLYLHRYTGEWDSPWFRTRSKWWHVDLFNRTQMDSVDLVSQGKTPTKVMFDGEWVATSNNAGLSARRRYGTGGSNIYRHKDYTMTYQQFYLGLSYVPCPEDSQRFNCIDKLPTDGNLGFGDPVP